MFYNILWRTILDVGEGNGTHSSTLAWKIPWTEEPGGLQSMGSGRVGHDWATSLSLFTFMHWRRKWQPTPVVLPGESQGGGSLVGCHLWSRTESDTTEVTQQQHIRCKQVKCLDTIMKFAKWEWAEGAYTPRLKGSKILRAVILVVDAH